VGIQNREKISDPESSRHICHTQSPREKKRKEIKLGFVTYLVLNIYSLDLDLVEFLAFTTNVHANSPNGCIISA
jgi:hypothetical protein